MRPMVCLLLFTVLLRFSRRTLWSTNAAPSMLNIRVIYETQPPPQVAERKVKVDLDAVYVNEQRMGRNAAARNIQNGQTVELNVWEDVGENGVDKVEFWFYISLSPTGDELVTDQQQSGDDHPPLDDDQPYNDEDYKIDDIRSMVRFVSVFLSKPNPTKRYLINLGRIDPPAALHWRRTLIIDRESDQEQQQQSNNYHALLSVSASKNKRSGRREDETAFVTYVPLLEIKNGNNESSNSAADKKKAFELSIPINLMPFFKKKIWLIELEIYRDESISTSEISPKKDKASNADEMCSICMEPMLEGQNIIKLHEGNKRNNNLTHMFHYQCIKSWFARIGTVQCPMCRRKAELALAVDFYPIFEGDDSAAQKRPPNLLYMNPIAAITRIVNDQNEAEFVRRQLTDELEQMHAHLLTMFDKLRDLLKDTPLMDGIARHDDLFLIASDGFFESPLLETLKAELEAYVADQRNLPEEVIATVQSALGTFRSLKNSVIRIATDAIENLGVISEEQPIKEKHVLISETELNNKRRKNALNNS